MKFVRLLLLFVLTAFYTGTKAQFKHQWSVSEGKSFSNLPKQIKCDKDNNIICLGISTASGDLFSDVLLCKYSSEGKLQWKHYIGKTGKGEHAGGLFIDNKNNIYISGSFEDKVNFEAYAGGDKTLTTSGYSGYCCEN